MKVFAFLLSLVMVVTLFACCAEKAATTKPTDEAAATEAKPAEGEEAKPAEGEEATPAEGEEAAPAEGGGEEKPAE